MNFYVLLITLILSSGERIDLDERQAVSANQRPFRSFSQCTMAAEEMRFRWNAHLLDSSGLRDHLDVAEVEVNCMPMGGF